MGLFAALAVELRTYCGFKVEEGGDVPASRERFTARYASEYAFELFVSF